MELTVIGERIKAARIDKKLTLERLSEKVGISRNFLWEIEAGRKTPAIQTLYSISKELNISVDYLFGLSETVRWLDSEDNDFSSKIEGLTKNLNDREMMLLYNLLSEYIRIK